MTYEDLSDVVKRKTAEIIGGVSPADLDVKRKLRSYGVSSLDLVELVSVLMRETRIKVARSELKKIGTTEELIAAFRNAADQPVAN